MTHAFENPLNSVESTTPRWIKDWIPLVAGESLEQTLQRAQEREGLAYIVRLVRKEFNQWLVEYRRKVFLDLVK